MYVLGISSCNPELVSLVLRPSDRLASHRALDKALPLDMRLLPQHHR